MSASAVECAMDAPASARLSEELWISFASLLRSHVAMRSIAGPDSGWDVLAATEGQIAIVTFHGKLRVAAPGGTGYGSIEGIGEEPNAFFFTEDGLIEFVKCGAEPSAAMEMETAVEYLLNEVCR